MKKGHLPFSLFRFWWDDKYQLLHFFGGLICINDHWSVYRYTIIAVELSKCMKISLCLIWPRRLMLPSWTSELPGRSFSNKWPAPYIRRRFSTLNLRIIPGISSQAHCTNWTYWYRSAPMVPQLHHNHVASEDSGRGKISSSSSCPSAWSSNESYDL